MAQPKSVHGVAAERLPLPRHEILHYLRGVQEDTHRHKLWIHEAFAKWVTSEQFNPTDLDKLPEMELGYANDCCNRAAPIYILRDRFVPDDAWSYIETTLELFLILLQNYLYARWFRPYRSDIEYGQFLTRVFVPRPSPLPNQTCSQQMVDFITALHSNTCTRVDAAQKRARDLADLAHDPKEQLERLNWSHDVYFKPAALAIREQEFYVFQPLFRAIAVVIRFNTNAHYEETMDVRSTPVLIIRTGVEDGLSAPILFDSISVDLRTGVLCGDDDKVTAIETTLETAVDFLLGLEQREIAAYGHRPNPVESTQNLELGYCEARDELFKTALRLGWNEDMQTLKEPSSTWVDTERYTEWSGLGADKDKMMKNGIFGAAGRKKIIMFLDELRAKALSLTTARQSHGQLSD